MVEKKMGEGSQQGNFGEQDRKGYRIFRQNLTKRSVRDLNRGVEIIYCYCYI